jgi:Glycosyltransferases involved in cell wall biogenesis
MSLINIVVPTYNEQDNVVPLSEAIIKIITEKLPEYDYEIIFIDNFSKDETRNRICELCKNNNKIKAIFNAKNFGQIRSPFYGLLQAHGDCNILMVADFQDPPEMIYNFVKEWENGHKIVVGIKSKSHESKFMYFMRSCYYHMIKRIAEVEQIEQFTGFGLYDKSFIEVLKNLDDPTPYMRGIVAELGYGRKEIEYTQPKRLHGKSKNNFFSLYDYAMIGITSYSKAFMRMATFIGFFLAGISALTGLIYFVLKLIFWDNFAAGMAPLLIGVFFIGAIQIFFIGILGEYIISINTRVMRRPLVVEEKRINFLP